MPKYTACLNIAFEAKDQAEAEACADSCKQLLVNALVDESVEIEVDDVEEAT